MMLCSCNRLKVQCRQELFCKEIGKFEGLQGDLAAAGGGWEGGRQSPRHLKR